LLGERTRLVYRLGDPVRVRVMRVDLDEAKIDFELAATPAGGKPAKQAAGLHRTKKRSGKRRTRGRRG
jgi:ribonuclease R